MKIYKEPSPARFVELSSRPQLQEQDLTATVAAIYADIASHGDEAVRDYTAKFDKVKLSSIVVSAEEIEQSSSHIAPELMTAVDVAYRNIHKFHAAQRSQNIRLETSPGVICEQVSRAIEKVGIYIPGGTAPLLSSVLMLAIPAQIAGCRQIVLCSPPTANGTVHPAILYCAKKCGISHIYKVGGAQAIAAMALGTTTIPSVSKIFGPGNQYVTAAKSYAARYGVAMDMPAGPSELLVYADESAVPSFVAADLLSQAEHGIDSQVILVTTTVDLAKSITTEIEKQLLTLPRKGIAGKALQNSKVVVLHNVETAWQYINQYAPEHLIIASRQPQRYKSLVLNAGSVFLGNYSPESAGDYATGTNHTLPTYGWAKSYSGVNVDAYCRKITYQEVTAEGLMKLGPTVQTLAIAETLVAHERAITIRLNTLK